MQLWSAGRLRGELGYRHRHGGFPRTVHGDLEAIRPGVRKRDAEDADGASFDIGHARRGPGEGDVAVAGEDFRVLLVEQANLDVMHADLGPLPVSTPHEVPPL